MPEGVGTRKLAGGAVFFFGARAVAGRLMAVSANRHSAPASRMAAGTVDKEQRTIMPFTGFDMGEVVLDNQIGHGFGNRDQQGIRRAPAALHL